MRFSTLVPTLALITLGACNPVPDPQVTTTPRNTGVLGHIIPIRGPTTGVLNPGAGLPNPITGVHVPVTGGQGPITAHPVRPRPRPDPTQEYNRCLAGSVCPQVFPESCFCANRLRRQCAEQAGLERVMVQDCASSSYFIQTRGRDGHFENLDQRPRPRHPSPRPRGHSPTRGDGTDGRNPDPRYGREGGLEVAREVQDDRRDGQGVDLQDRERAGRRIGKGSENLDDGRDTQPNTNLNSDINSNRVAHQTYAESDDRRPTVVRLEDVRRTEPNAPEHYPIAKAAGPREQHLHREPAEIRLPVQEHTRPIEAIRPIEVALQDGRELNPRPTRNVRFADDRERTRERDHIHITSRHGQSVDSDRPKHQQHPPAAARYDAQRDQQKRYEAQQAQDVRDSQLRRELNTQDDTNEHLRRQRDRKLRFERDQRDDESRHQREHDAELRRSTAAHEPGHHKVALQKRSPTVPPPSFSPSREFSREHGSQDPQGDVRYYRNTEPVLILLPGAEPLAAVEDSELWVAKAEVTGRRGRYWQGNGHDGKGNLLAETPEGLVALNKFLFGEGISFTGAGGGEGVSAVPAGEGVGRTVGKFDHIVPSERACKCLAGGGKCACNGECRNGCDCAGKGGYAKQQTHSREPLPRTDQYRDSQPRSYDDRYLA